MSFIWPVMLVFLTALPLFGMAYFWLQRRRERLITRSQGFGLVQSARGKGLGWRRHFPPILFFIGLGVLIVSMARPQTVVSLPRVEGTLILAFDVSGSMAATDLEPSRMEAAKAAAIDFVGRQPSTVNIGVVAFSEGGFAVLPPTNDPEPVLAAIQRLRPERGTSIADGILASLNAINEQGGAGTSDSEGAPSADSPTPAPVPPGSFTSAAIVLLTDGENTAPPDPFEAAQVAADRGVRVFTIGIGSATGTTLEVEGFTVHTRLDEVTLEQIARMTGGEYFNAQNEDELNTVYERLTPQLVVKDEKTEVTSIFAGASLLIFLVGAAFSLFWFNRLP